MESSQRQSKPAPRAETTAEEAVEAPAERPGAEVIEDIDDLLDEIDALLEEQSVLTNFRQKGGQ